MKVASLAKMSLGAARYRLTGHRVPLHVLVTVTHQCNALCAYCAVPLQRVQELSTEEWGEILDRLARRGTTRVSISGGEPLTRADIGLLIDRCHTHGIYTSLESNGHLVPQRIGELKNLRQLVLSLDGRPANHDLLREHGSYKKVMQAIEVAKAAGIEVWTLTALTRRNIDDVGYILDQAEALGFTANFQVLQGDCSPYGKGGERLRADQAETQRVLRELLEARLAGRPVGISEKTLRYLLTWQDFRQTTDSTPHEDLHCLAGQLYCAIDADGTLSPCTLQAGSFGGKNIREVGFDAAFDTLRDNPCAACTSSALTEYNYLYNLNLPALVEYARARRWREERKVA